MHDDLEGLLARLAAQPVPLRLNGMEARVGQSIRRERTTPALPWRYAAVGLALVAGVGIGGSAAAVRQPPAGAADLSGGIGFAPSSLLDAST